MILVFETGAFRIMCSHVLKKGNGYYYRRRVPNDVRALHTNVKSQGEIKFSLKTTDKTEACRRADAHTRRLDAMWKAHREGLPLSADPLVAVGRLHAAGLKPGDGVLHHDHPTIEGFLDSIVPPREPYEPEHRLSAQDELTVDILYGAPVPKTLSDARALYFELGKGPRENNKNERRAFDQAWELLLDVAGDITLDRLGRAQARAYVQRLIAKGNAYATVKRIIARIKPVIDTAINEFELDVKNPFEKVIIPNKGEPTRRPRDTYTMPELEAIQQKCRQVDDQRRWAIAMISDTGARLAEIVGIRKEDVFLDAPVPHIHIQPTDDRGVKTKESARKVPLVGEALWGAKRALSTEGPMLFPVFLPKERDKAFNANTASAALNKWLKENGLARDGQGNHSFRHTMRDRLRDVECPTDLRDSIGGWKTPGVGESYGKGHSLEIMQKYLLKTVRAVERDTGAEPEAHAS